jgi:hypothetical protein
MERKIIILLTLILIGIGVFGCAKPNVDTVPEDSPIVSNTPVDTPTVSNLEAIANVLGCMFDPTPCQAKKDLAKTEDK